MNSDEVELSDDIGYQIERELNYALNRMNQAGEKIYLHKSAGAWGSLSNFVYEDKRPEFYKNLIEIIRAFSNYEKWNKL